MHHRESTRPLNSDGYIRRQLAVLSAAFHRAIREGEISAAPLVLLPAESRYRERVATPWEMAQLLAAAKSDRLQFYLLLAIGTAARPEAILELTTSQCDIVDQFIQLNPRGRRQNKKRRPTIPMASFLVPVIATAATGQLIQFNGRRLKSIRTPWRRMVADARRQFRLAAVIKARKLCRIGRRADA